MATHLTKKYRIIWDTSTNYIQNDYEKDWTGTMTSIINPKGFLESDTYQDILDKITNEGLTRDPSMI